MVQLLTEQAVAVPPNLDNVHINGQNPCSQEVTMSKEHRLRVKVGNNDDGTAIIRQVRGKSELELADNVIRAVIQSGRIWEMLPRPMEQAPEIVKTNFKEFAEKWRRLYKDGVAENTKAFLDAKLNVLYRTFGEMFIEDITMDDVQAFLKDRSEKYAKKTVKADWALLREVLSSAVEHGIITKNPAKAKGLKNSAVDKGGTKSLTRAQITDICRAMWSLTDSKERIVMALLTQTTCRREEMLGLKWENVDFENRCIYVREAVTYPRSRAVIKGVKTESSDRAFPMSDTLYAVLWPLRKPEGYLLEGRKGGPVSEPTFRRLWKSIGEKIDLYGTTPINFRTTFATMAVHSGVDIRTVQDLMGHSTPDMTLKTYVKKDEEMMSDALVRMSGILSGTGKAVSGATTGV